MFPTRFSLLVTAFLFASGTSTVIHDCNYFHNGVYNIRYCAFSNVIVMHDAEEIVFRSEYPRPYFFEFNSSKLTEIPRILFTSFPEMQNLDVVKSQIENINKYTFEHAKDLRYLNLSSNQLTVLNNFAFKGCDKLVRLDVSNNRITDVKSNALSDASKLDHLDLSGNLLEVLDENLFSKLNLLTYLSMANNKLKTLPDHLLDNCTMIAYLDLRDNQIQTIADSFMKGLTYLRTLIVHNNKLTSLTIPQQLTKLLATRNRLSSIYAVEPDKSQLYVLSLSKNQLTGISNITMLESLGVLDISFNPIGPLNLTTFLKLRKLVDLNLEATQLNRLEYGLFTQQSKLRRLDISYNFLRKIDLTVLTSTPALEKLFIDGNGLLEINFDHIPKLFPNLTYLGLFANAWNCSYLSSLVQFCNHNGIEVSSTKSYGEMLYMTNVQGIYCAGSDHDRVYFQPSTAVQHEDENLNQDKDLQLELIAGNISSTDFEYKLMVDVLEMIRTVNATNSNKLEEVRRIALGSGGGCTAAIHSTGYQVFIMLILTFILVINVGFLLYVHYNANARRAIDRMIIFRRGETASVQTQLEEELARQKILQNRKLAKQKLDKIESL
ncbi:leucine-rich repeat-containing G-protein coupled receptor 4-like [Sabethes cyaneus]|uniref:leucine-rich repeat-containing G-protein coupled receptor 4-like n=1 Tax=Sabethes cyaneus TaxID=53552 RepID=UPI00237E4E99|nr:leucine-rich repeat-containing G-protein coupled receptor 4-like [Sabethes cyaneus]